MLSKTCRKGALALGLGLAVAGGAYATITFNPDTGTGFVGKGDVQSTFGWNNALLQQKANDVLFRALSTVVTEVSWICTNSNNDNIMQRKRTITTTTQDLVNAVVRQKNQITGFILSGYIGTPTPSSTIDGPMLNSCPSGPWSLTTSAGDPAVVSSSIRLQVSNDEGSSWRVCGFGAGNG